MPLSQKWAKFGVVALKLIYLFGDLSQVPQLPASLKLELSLIMFEFWKQITTTGAKKDHYLLPFGVNLPLGFEFHAVSSLVVSPLRCEGHALEVALLEPH